MKGAKSNFQINAINMKPNCHREVDHINYMNHVYICVCKNVDMFFELTFSALTTIRMVIDTA